MSYSNIFKLVKNTPNPVNANEALHLNQLITVFFVRIVPSAEAKAG